jgi:hypothetical protein
MFSRFRFFAMATLFSVAPNAWGQQPVPAAIPPQLASNANAKKDTETKVFYLRNVAVTTIQATLKDLYGADGGFVVSADPRLNALVVVGTPMALEKVETLLKALDQPPAEPIVVMVPRESQASISKNLAQAVAEASQVDLAYDEELGVMMVRSESSDRVERFREILDRFHSQVRDEAKVEDREVLVHISWLAPKVVRGETLANPIGANEKVAIDKLASMGYADLIVAGQLMTRCSISSSTSASVSEFEAEGSTVEGFNLGVRGHLNSRVGHGDGSVDVKMSVTVNRVTKSEKNNDCLLAVVLKMKKGKPIILGSAPVEGAQSFFVVQFIDAE